MTNRKRRTPEEMKEQYFSNKIRMQEQQIQINDQKQTLNDQKILLATYTLEQKEQQQQQLERQQQQLEPQHETLESSLYEKIKRVLIVCGATALLFGGIITLIQLISN